MRHVYPSSKIAHLWAHQTQADARNPQGNFFFEGDTIYSYRRNWPIAKIYTKGKGKAEKKIVLINSATYSSTTAKQTNDVRYSCSQFDRVTVPYPAFSGHIQYTNTDEKVANLDYLFKEMDKLVAKAGRSQSISTVEYLQADAIHLYSQAVMYNDFFKVVRKLKPMPSFDKAIARRTRLDAPDPLKDAKAFKAKQSRERAQAKKELWKEGADFVQFCNSWRHLEQWEKDGGSRYSGYSSYGLPVFLRLSKNGEEIETSQGASVPVKHARLLYWKINKLKANGQTYQRNGHTIHVGHYPLDSIDLDGNVRVGCHSITFKTIYKLAEQLGWNNPEVEDNAVAEYATDASMLLDKE